MDKEIVVPEKGGELYNSLLEIFEGNDDELDTGLAFAEQKIEDLVEEITDDLNDAFIREEYCDSYEYCLWILVQLNPQFRTIKIKESLVYEKVELDLEDSILLQIYDKFIDDYSYAYFLRFAKIVELIEKQDAYKLTKFETDLHEALLYHLELSRKPVWGWGKSEDQNKKMWCWEITRDKTRAVWNHMYVKSQKENKELNKKVNTLQHEQLTGHERGEEPKKQSTEKKKKSRGRTQSILFSDEEVKQRECKRVKEYLRECNLQVAKWRREKTDPIQKVAICFVRHWKERGYIDEKYSPRALARFLVEDCGVQMADPGKDLGNAYDNLGQGVKLNVADFDGEIYDAVGRKFK